MTNQELEIVVIELINNGELKVGKTGGCTCLGKLTLENGFEMFETASCLDPENYSEKVLKAILIDKFKLRLWENERYRGQCEKINEEQSE